MSDVLINFDPNKFIDNLVRIYCKQHGFEPAEWKFVDEDKKEEGVQEEDIAEHNKTAKEVESAK